jgi:hypothetical protein
MATNVPIELRAYSPAREGSLVFDRIWELQTGGQPIASAIVEAFFQVAVEGTKKLQLSFGNGLTYNAVAQSIRIQITNEQVKFIKETTSMEYAFYVVFEHEPIQTLREGAVNAVRVA